VSIGKSYGLCHRPPRATGRHPSAREHALQAAGRLPLPPSSAAPSEQPRPRRLPVLRPPSCPCPAARACGLPAADRAGQWLASRAGAAGAGSRGRGGIRARPGERTSGRTAGGHGGTDAGGGKGRLIFASPVRPSPR
jgi:hypothetical protein